MLGTPYFGEHLNPLDGKAPELPEMLAAPTPVPIEDEEAFTFVCV